ncbi:MAG: hypothetical protein GY838_04030, partial [bacterium]|nr:hypothetical protein [bacterium]
PNVTVDTPADGSLVSTELISVQGNVEDPYLASVTVNGIPGTISGDRYTASDVPLTEGENLIAATAEDQAGNSLTTPPILVVLDTLAPVLTMDTSDLPQLTGIATVTVGGTVSDPHLDSVRVNETVAMVSGDQWVATDVPLAEGENVLTAHALDTLGATSSSPGFTITLDTLAPAIVMSQPSDGEGFDSNQITVSGTVSDPHLDPSTVTVNGVVATVTNDAFSAELVLAEGSTQVVVEAAD